MKMSQAVPGKRAALFHGVYGLEETRRRLQCVPVRFKDCLEESQLICSLAILAKIQDVIFIAESPLRAGQPP
jgi:hypothetical protein